MSGQDPAPHSMRALSKGRMEGFSDGVFGFAITLLVLDLAIQPPGGPLQQVLNGWPSYMAYLVSFLTIGVAWLAHTRLTDRLVNVDPILLRINLLLLFVIVFLPFPTRLASSALHDSAGERVFVTMYGLTLLTISLLGMGMNAYATDQGLYRPQDEDDGVGGVGPRLPVIVVGYVVAILIGLLVPVVAVLLYLCIAVYLVVPFREVRRLLARRRAAPVNRSE